MTSRFDGFPNQTFKFLRDLKKNNDRDWFNANKARYKDYVVAPMVSFIEAMDGRLAKVSDCFVADPRPNGGSMFRIYRDTRFSNDKTPYKEHIACHFRHMAGKDAHAPGFYVHLENEQVFFGGGIWHAENAVLNQIRQAIVDDPDGWKAATRKKAFRERFGGLEGDSLKRPPQGFDPDHPFIDDIKRKDFFGIQSVKPQVARTPEFVDEVTKAFVALKPLMEFLTVAVGLSFQLDEDGG
jgi:uncharacterized protein (TIGR02453 family)